MKFARSIILFAFCLVIGQGCVGVMILKTKRETFQPPAFSNYWPDVYCVSQQQVVSTNTYTPNWATTNSSWLITNSAPWLLNNWGKPSSVVFQSFPQREIWTYKRRLIWNGCVLYVGIPIPIILPVAREKIVLVLRDGWVMSATVTRITSWDATAGLGVNSGPCRPTWSYHCGNEP